MKTRYVVLGVSILILHSGYSYAQEANTEYCQVPQAYELGNAAVDTYMRILVPQTKRDTTDLRTALGQLHLAYEIDSTCWPLLWSMAVIHSVLSEPDSVVAVLELGLDDNPYLAEHIGYTRTAQGRLEEAKVAFEHALLVMEKDLPEVLLKGDDLSVEEYAASWIRLVWLTHGKEPALVGLNRFEPDIAAMAQVQYVLCLIHKVDPRTYAADSGRYKWDISDDSKVDHNRLCAYILTN
jgi:hypothetical protein